MDARQYDAEGLNEIVLACIAFNAFTEHGAVD